MLAALSSREEARVDADGEPSDRAGPPTIFDVARRAGVSPSTVSRSLRGVRNVAPTTRTRVALAADELGYVASPAASRLASGRTRTIGIVVPFLHRWYFAQIMRGVEQVLRESTYDLLLTGIGGDPPGRERFFGRLPFSRKVDGVILVDVAVGPDEQTALRALGVPIAAIGGNADDAGAVGIDEEGSVRTAISHLVHLGHAQIAMIAADPEPGLQLQPPARRRSGFDDALRESGVEPRPEWLVTAPWGVEGGARSMAALLGGSALPTAVFAECDELAFGALRTLRLAGLEVPRDISIIGFDDHDLASVVNLTTIRQPVEQIGAAAANLLLSALDGSSDPSTHIVLPTSLVVRGSTAPPARRRRRP